MGWAMGLKTYLKMEGVFISYIACSQVIVIIQDLSTLYVCDLLSKKYDYTSWNTVLPLFEWCYPKNICRSLRNFWIIINCFGFLK